MRRANLVAGAIAAALLAGCAGAQEPATPPPSGAAEAQDPNVLRQRAFALAQRGDASAAADAFLDLARVEPTEPDWLVQAGDQMGKAARFNDAMDVLEGARKRFPDALALTAMLARTYHLKADHMVAQGVRDANVIFYYEDAARTARQVTAVDPDHLDARLIVASALYQLGNLDAALAEAEEAVRRRPDAYGGQAMVGRVRFQRFVQTRQELGADDLDAERRGDLTKAAAEDQDAARVAFEAASEADTARSFPRARLGDLAAWSGNLEDAKRWYGEAMSLDPQAQVDHAWLRTAVPGEERRAMYAAARDRYAARADATPRGVGTLRWYEAQSVFDQAANTPATEPPATRTALWKEAAKIFDEAWREVPDYVDTGWWLVQSQYWGGDVAAASKTAVDFARRDAQRFADMIRRDEQTVAALVGMAATAYGKGKLAESRDLNLVIAYARQTADAWNNYAFLCRETGRFEQSLAAYEEALRIEPESPQLLNDAAVILHYHLRGDGGIERARSYYRDAIRLAEAQLAAGGLDVATADRTRTALRDAKANLAKLR
ncbi:MAG: tetratricopeptide repeat protein [Planctomycetota bacterium]|nr:tetratricopeptide repeat protein [Planctomycetota bacterium]MDA0934739.1 tetratricopeptide repeat protein [Planctomycetota bacterium]MDA1222312.1 tetratricopeptide repeat protein [Planctomycetota bacterium]